MKPWLASVVLFLLGGIISFLPCFSLKLQQQKSAPSLKNEKAPPLIEKSSNKNTSPLLQGVTQFLTVALDKASRSNTVGDPEIRSSPSQKLKRISQAALVQGLKKDYENNYFLTGAINEDLYDEQCTFVDPTLSFTGLQLWKRNISNLKQFFIEPNIELIDIKLEKNVNGIRARWVLSTVLALPWRPKVCVGGSTLHTYESTKGNRVVYHEEMWDVSALEAILQLFRPGGKEEASL
mmetsp:Transcript_24764/g.39220  ORF Transcript_24764/g.39220 Transcript_24764/m.39220 type:complete len:236 (-) Transcript_24764:249-956(-)